MDEDSHTTILKVFSWYALCAFIAISKGIYKNEGGVFTVRVVSHTCTYTQQMCMNMIIKVTILGKQLLDCTSYIIASSCLNILE